MQALYQRRLRRYLRLAITTQIILLLLLAAFQAIWVLGGSASGIMEQTGLQRTRAQNIAKDVLILAYRPADARPQAVSELQNILPRFEQTQTGLQNGNTTLQLPAHVPDNIAQLLIAAQSDYISIDSATKLILAHTDKPVDAIQLAIILNHEHGYALAMTQVDMAWKQHIDNAFAQIFWIEIGLNALLIVLNAPLYYFVSRRIIPHTHNNSSQEASGAAS